MSLDRTLAPFEREPSFHGLVVALKPQRETLQFSHSLLFDSFEPGVQLLALPLTQHGCEALDEVIRFCDFLVSLTETTEVIPLPLQALLFLKRDPMSHLQSGGGTF